MAFEKKDDGYVYWKDVIWKFLLDLLIIDLYLKSLEFTEVDAISVQIFQYFSAKF